MPHECSVPTEKCIESYKRIIREKHKTMIQCQANAGPTLKAVCHLCGSIGPMSSVSRYLLWQCGNAISHTMAHVNRDPSKHETPKQCWADTGPKSWTMGQHQPNTGSTSRVCWDVRSNWGGGPRVVVSTAAFHARVRGSVPGLGGLKETIVSSPSTCES